MNTESSLLKKVLTTLIAIIAIGGVGYGTYIGYTNYQNLKKEKQALESELTKTKTEFASTTAELSANIEAIKQLLVATNADKINAEQGLHQQQEILDAMSGTVTIYEKLISTDRELLMKYSKVFFLSENYSPKSSILIPGTYLYYPSKEGFFLRDAWPFLKKMLDDANTAGVDIKVLSAFRSFDTQTKLKNTYTVTYGTNSNQFSADQGYSEHQLGTAVDFTTKKLGVNFDTFKKTDSYTWLINNAYKYGFIISYPEDNAYYIFEPWHWRFVGKALALRLHNENLNFVDLSQRDINEYLPYLFDNSPTQ